MKWLIGAAFVAIIAALVSAGVFMMRGGREGQSKSGHMMRALALRVGLSVALFLCILIAYQLGWIRPTGLPIGY
jgi:apolipoprotein N-acyltransferase